jgi:hypothetical protein
MNEELLKKVRWQAMYEIAAPGDSLEAEGDREQAITNYINRLTNVELLELIERATN